MIRREWLEALEFVAQASLADLIDPAVRKTGRLEGDLGLIRPQDAAMLAEFGLPAYGGYGLHPAIGQESVWRGNTRIFPLGSYDPALDSEDPEHLFITETTTGQVVKVSQAIDGYHLPINDSIGQFVEVAWRYYHLAPVVMDMHYSGPPGDTPFAFQPEDQAVREHAWATILRAAPSLDRRYPFGFWWAAVWSIS